MSRFAIWSSIDPTTCFETSNPQILSGRCGLSLHLLYTSDNSARAPNAPCMKTANGPSNWHSPFSTSSGSDPAPKAMAEAVATITLVAVGIAVELVTRAVKAGWNGAKVIEEVLYAGLDVAVASNAEIAPIEDYSRLGCRKQW